MKMSRSSRYPEIMAPAPSAKLLDPKVWEKRYFDGAWKPAPAALNVREPATGESLGTAGGGTAELAAELTNRAAEAQPKWGEAMAEERARIMRDAARILEANAPEIAEWIIREPAACVPRRTTKSPSRWASCVIRRRCSRSLLARSCLRRIP